MDPRITNTLISQQTLAPPHISCEPLHFVQKFGFISGSMYKSSVCLVPFLHILSLEAIAGFSTIPIGSSLYTNLNVSAPLKLVRVMHMRP